MTVLLDPDKAEDVDKAVAYLQRGELVGMPTETVYGLAGNALDDQACARIYAAKKRPSFDPLIAHLHHKQQAQQLVQIDPVSERLIDLFWPGPLTLILPRLASCPLSELISAGLPTVGLRVPAHPVARNLLARCNFPLAAPSANIFGNISPTDAKSVSLELDGRIAGILDGGSCVRGLESTVIKVDQDSRINILRLGALAPQSIAEALNIPLEQIHIQRSTSKPQQALESPGTIDRHYAPRTPMRLCHSQTQLQQALDTSPRPGALLLCEPLPKDTQLQIPDDIATYTLSASGDSIEAASKLFAQMRQLDNDKYNALICLAPKQDMPGGLAPAILDRLTRACADTN